MHVYTCNDHIAFTVNMIRPQYIDRGANISITRSLSILEPLLPHIHFRKCWIELKACYRNVDLQGQIRLILINREHIIYSFNMDWLKPSIMKEGMSHSGFGICASVYMS